MGTLTRHGAGGTGGGDRPAAPGEGGWVVTGEDRTVSAGGIARDLTAAREQLASLSDLVREALDSPEHVRGRIVAPVGLVTFADRDVLEQDGVGLRPWLDDLAAAALGGRRDGDVARGLAEWRALAVSTEQAARAVTSANAVGLNQRRELRGRLAAVHGKAARLGLAEDEELSALHARAFEELYRAPTDLAEAERLTMAYVRALHSRDVRAEGPGR